MGEGGEADARHSTPITNAQEYYGYQKARDTLADLIREREAQLIAAINDGDETLIEDRRAGLAKVYRNRQGAIDAIKAYERSHQQSA